METSRLPSVDAVLTVAADLPALAIGGTPTDQLRLALRLAERALPPAVIALARTRVTDHLAEAALDDPPRSDDLQLAWESWASDPAGNPFGPQFTTCRSELIDLFLGGNLTPVVGEAAGLPEWAAIGVRFGVASGTG